MKRMKSNKLQLDRVQIKQIKPLEEKVLEHVTGGKGGACHENSIVPTNRNCCF